MITSSILIYSLWFQGREYKVGRDESILGLCYGWHGGLVQRGPGSENFSHPKPQPAMRILGVFHISLLTLAHDGSLLSSL